MPTHALLGATGGTGSAVLRYLLDCPPKDLRLNIFVRSEKKLLSIFPDLNNGKQRIDIHIYTGQLTAANALDECLSEVEVIYNCLATNDSKKGVSIAQDAASAIISSLKIHREQAGYRSPFVLINRSMALNPTFMNQEPYLMRNFVLFSLHFVYEDIRLAYRHFISAADGGLLGYVFVDPPAIHDPDGAERTGYELIVDGKPNPGINYADLGAAMVEVAGRRVEFEGGAVGVSATGHVRENMAPLYGNMFRGLRARVLGW